MKGKEVVAILYAERTETHLNAKGGVTKSNFKIYDRSITLDTEKLYTKQGSPYTYKVHFVIPQTGASTPSSAGSGIGAVERLAAGAIGVGTNLVRWYIKVELKHEAMLTFPIAKTQEINIISRAPQPAAGL